MALICIHSHGTAHVNEELFQLFFFFFLTEPSRKYKLNVTVYPAIKTEIKKLSSF